MRMVRVDKNIKYHHIIKFNFAKYLCTNNDLTVFQKCYISTGSDQIDNKLEDGPTEYINDKTIDPLLRENFKLMFNTIYQRLKLKKESAHVNEM